MINDDLSKKSPHFREKYLVLSYLKALDLVSDVKRRWRYLAHLDIGSINSRYYIL